LFVVSLFATLCANESTTKYLMPDSLLKPTEARLLSAVRRLSAGGAAPSLDEVAREAGFSSRSSIHRPIQRLIEHGYLTRDRSQRSLRLAGEPGAAAMALPHLGRIAAGRPIEAVPGSETIHLGELLCRGNRYVLTVEGDSMIELGIDDGDLVVIDRDRTPRAGDIVVALVDGTDNTLKTLHIEADGQVLLVPANSRLSAMRYDPQRVALQGVMVAQVRMRP